MAYVHFENGVNRNGMIEYLHKPSNYTLCDEYRKKCYNFPHIEDQYIVDPKHLQKMNVQIGRGNFSIVELYNYNGVTVAVKIQKGGFNTLILENEIEALKRLDHNGVVKLIGVSIVDQNPVLILEYIEGCPLTDFLKKNSLDYVQRFSIIYSIADTMMYINEANVTHNDLWTSNILYNNSSSISTNSKIKIIDFGHSESKGKNSLNHLIFKGNLSYLAPELYLNNKRPSEKGDVFSFSIIMWQILTNSQLPTNHIELIAGDVNYRLETKSLPEYWRKLMDVCWSGDPSVRPSFKEIKDYLNNNKDRLNVA